MARVGARLALVRAHEAVDVRRVSRAVGFLRALDAASLRRVAHGVGSSRTVGVLRARLRAVAGREVAHLAAAAIGVARALDAEVQDTAFVAAGAVAIDVAFADDRTRVRRAGASAASRVATRPRSASRARSAAPRARASTAASRRSIG